MTSFWLMPVDRPLLRVFRALNTMAGSLILAFLVFASYRSLDEPWFIVMAASVIAIAMLIVLIKRLLQLLPF